MTSFLCPPYLGNWGQQGDDEAGVLLPDDLPGRVEGEGGLAEETGEAGAVHPAVDVDRGPRVDTFSWILKIIFEPKPF